uniref:Uncharacterized protein n=1 Tax=Timema genevievae TaxID=629358 RepID=A0A7R9PNB9_TIMGE|nr:unnamed protein product [Timema genevievae]
MTSPAWSPGSPHRATFTELFLLMRGRKLFGSRLKVIPRSSKKRFIPFSKFWGVYLIQLKRMTLHTPFDDLGSHETLLRVEVGRGLINEVHVGRFSEAQRKCHSL